MTKIISLKNSVYERLKKIKGDKSFSEEIDELIEISASSKKGNLKELMKYYGVWGREEGEKFQKEIARSRKNAKPRFF